MSGSGAAYWDDQAATYDRTTAFLEPRLFAPARQWIADRVTGRTLEVGVGTGANLPYLAGRVTDLTLTDLSGEMLRAAAARAAALGVDVRLLQADSAHLDLPDDAFDTVVSTLALCCVDDELAVLREVARVLRPGGLLLMADHVESSTRLGRGVQGVLERVSPRRAGSTSADAPCCCWSRRGWSSSRASPRAGDWSSGCPRKSSARDVDRGVPPLDCTVRGSEGAHDTARRRP